ncbi:hypothetical protein GALL_475250 [mine drainage metagenome]|jgi:hypothetical protein|uniref:DUF2523 domain-containing protein n=1 Tax=mine drainage metagenome TaxID=410659 RepID=A0A1J5PTD7_9ZZZZ
MSGLFAWLESAVSWFVGIVWQALHWVLQGFMDVAIWVFGGILSAFAILINGISLPSFLQGGLGGLFTGLDPGVLFFIGAFGIPQGLALIGAGFSFRLIRKLVTLFQW